MVRAVFAVLLLSVASLSVQAAPPPADGAGRGLPVEWIEWQAGRPVVHFWFFWSRFCPHCQEARPFIEQIAAQRPWLQLHAEELTSSETARQRYRTMATLFGQEASSVPAFFFCGTMAVGFDAPEGIGAQLVGAVDECHRQVVEAGRGGEQPAQREVVPPEPIAGLSELSLPLLTIAVAALDAFNPCAFFVLLFLLSLLVHARSRGRMLLIGGVFVFFSGFIYFLFMAAWLNVFLLFGQLRAVTAIAGLVAIAMALLNVKDAVRPGLGPSLSIADEAKPGLFRRMRGLLQAERLPTLLLGTVALAVAANAYELLCTSGLPMLYTRILTLEALPPAGYYLYLVLYNLVYVVPLALIVVAFTYTLGSRKLKAEEGQVLKLLSGLMMLGLGLVLVVAPTRLQDLGVAAGIVGVALVLTLVYWVYRRRKRVRHPG